MLFRSLSPLPQLVLLLFASFVAISTRADPSIEKGRYLVKISGCNDCHTSGYGMKNGEVPEEQWLTGDPTGWTGPWGTTYAINLRAHVAGFAEDDWVKSVRITAARPPMPWYVLRDMKEEDVRSIYRFIKSLAPNAAPIPTALPPGQLPPAPYFQLVLPVAPPLDEKR